MKIENKVTFKFTDEEKEAFKKVIKCFREIEDSDGLPKVWTDGVSDSLCFMFDLFYTTKDGLEYWQDQIAD